MSRRWLSFQTWIDDFMRHGLLSTCYDGFDHDNPRSLYYIFDASFDWTTAAFCRLSVMYNYG